MTEESAVSAAPGTRKHKAIGYLVAALILAALLYFANYRELIEAFGKMTAGSVAYLLLISLLLLYISALKWHYFLEAFGSTVPVLRLTGLYLIGYFVNLIVPSYVGGDVARSFYVGKKVGQHEAATATILERYTGLVAMVVLAFLFVWFVQTTTVQIEILVVGITLGLALITGIALSPRTMSALRGIPKLSPLLKHMGKIQEGLQLAARDKTLLAKSLALSFLYHSITVVNTMAAGYVVGWYSPPVGDLFVVLPLILLVGAIPITPSGLGIQEGAFYYFLGSIGATPAQALGVAVVLRAKAYLLALGGAVVWVIERRRHAR